MIGQLSAGVGNGDGEDSGPWPRSIGLLPAPVGVLGSVDDERAGRAVRITNRVDDVRDFAKEYGSIVYKALQNTELVGSDGSAAAIWVDEVDPADLDDTVGATLHMFQQRLEKTADVRTTVIGNRTFSVRIESPCLDWRRDYEQVDYTVIDTPDHIVLRCRQYLDRFGLLFGAFDFGIAHDGSWVWYECNTAGQWHWLERETGLPMTAALADLLEITR